MDKLRPGWTVVRRNLAVTKTEGLHNTTLRRHLSVIGVHLIDMVTPSEGLQKFKLTIANTVITQENSNLNTMGTDQLLDLFTLDSDSNSKGDSKDIAQGPSRAGIKGVLESLPELWDSSKYDSEYDLGNFLSTLKPK
ncbi:hypothetical protein HPB50_025060 [Hyalomma asiaticum]|uniref:Uncharacterized protein n=1 Tax=Hyalomma asiaticum TaxID=266040 RepID=A0ACB7TC06_HYAAI|nr:hypothetical protein HPB50_025060 [Hyalomma asiaticum]